MICAVLHKEGTAVAVLAHSLQDGGHGCDLPVTFPAVAVTLGHQVLEGQAGQLLHTVQILKGVGENVVGNNRKSADIGTSDKASSVPAKIGRNA